MAAEHGLDVGPGAVGIRAPDAEHGVERLGTLGRRAGVERHAVAHPAARPQHQRLELLRRHGLEDLAIELGDERVGAVRQRERALQPARGAVMEMPFTG